MLDEIDIFKDYLRQQNLRWTPQRKMILESFLSLKGNLNDAAVSSNNLTHEDLPVACFSIKISSTWGDS